MIPAVTRAFSLRGAPLVIACAAGLSLGCGAGEPPVAAASDGAQTHLNSRVEAEGLLAGAAELASRLPIGVPQGGYTGRMFPLSLPVDRRETPYTTQFIPSAGVATRIPVKVVWLQQGGDPLIFAKIDLIYAFEGLLFAIEDAITDATGVDVHDRVILATNHSHASYGTHSQDAAMYLGGDQFNREVFDRMVGEVTSVATQAHASLAPAAIGVGFDPDFDPIGVDRIFRDRRSENSDIIGVDGLPLGPGYKDPRLTLIRVDHTQGTASTDDDTPVGVLFHFGMHGTILSDDNPYLSTDAPGGVEMKFQESFDTPVVVMHLQGGAGDVSPAGSQSDWARIETIGELATPKMQALWNDTPTRSGSDITLSAATRSVTQDRDRIAVTRGGTVDLRYDAFRTSGRPDNVVYNDDGTVASPIDEFNTEVGAALCGSDVPVPGVLWSVGASAYPYQSCAQVDTVIRGLMLKPFKFDLGWVEYPVQAAQQAVLSAVRIGNVPIRQGDGSSAVDDFIIGAFPGEPVTLFSDTFRAEVADYYGYDNAICVGYAQDHEGYLLTVEDWLAGGYEPSINQWGPLQGEYLLEQAVALVGSLDGEPLPSTVVPDRNWDEIMFDLDPVIPEVTLEAGSVPASLPDYMLTRTGVMPTQAQPASQIPRVTGIASFVFYGGDPAIDMPTVVLERQVEGEWQTVTKRSGRPVDDATYEMFVSYTPDPLESSRDRHHLYLVEWQAVQDFPSLDYMAGVPEGTYRFKATGRANKGNLGEFPYTGVPYVATSNPFSVVPASLLVGASGDASNLQITASYPAQDRGWRLLSMTSDFRSATALVGAGDAVTAKVDIINSIGQVVFTQAGVSLTSGGDASTGSVNAATVGAGTYTVRVTDVFGNRGTTQIQL